jgi:hypothetical protein
MIVRERPDSFLLVKQHDHALASGEFARHWAEQPWPLGPTLYAITQHDVAWQGPDASVRWNEEAGRPYSFMDYPLKPKVAAYAAGLDLLEAEDPYAACLCSMHYETLMRRSEGELEGQFREAEISRQHRLRAKLSEEEIGSLDQNLRFLKLCDGLSLFVCLNEPGQGENPPPYPEGFVLDGQKFEPFWEDDRTLRLDPNPFSGPFGISVPYHTVGRDGHALGNGSIELTVISRAGAPLPPDSAS